MPDSQYRILSAWHDVLVYSEDEGGGEGRKIEFSCPSLVEPPQVNVPAPAHWAAQVPAWARERRALIVERLRASGATVHERDGDLTIVQSPDGSLRVESLVVPDDRAAAWESTRVIALPGGQVLANLTLHAVTGAITFPAPGSVDLSLHGRYGSKHRLRINTIAQSFVLDAQPEQPLANLEPLLYPPERGELSPAVTASANWLVQGGSALGSLVFVAGGVWMAFGAATTKDRLIGAACALFFGVCAGIFIADLRRGRAPRK